MPIKTIKIRFQLYVNAKQKWKWGRYEVNTQALEGMEQKRRTLNSF